MADRIEFEEQVLLIKELKATIKNNVNNKLPSNITNLNKASIKKTSSAIIKGQLFTYYAVTNNKQAYKNINNHSKAFKDKINHYITEEGYILHKNKLQIMEEYEQGSRIEFYE